MNQKQLSQHKKRILSLSLACFFLITSCGDNKEALNTPSGNEEIDLEPKKNIELAGNNQLVASKNEVKSEIQESWILDINSVKSHPQFQDWRINDKTKRELKEFDIRKVINIAAAKKDLDSWKEWLKENNPKRMWFFALRAAKGRKNFHKAYAKYRDEIMALSSTIDQLSRLQAKEEEQLDKHDQINMLAYKYTALWRVDGFIANTKDEFLKFKQKYPKGYKKKKAKRL